MPPSIREVKRSTRARVAMTKPINFPGPKAREPYAGALERNLNEIEMALINERIMRRIAGTPFEWEFFRFAWMALFNDRIARAARVFDHHRGAHGFWFITGKKPAEAKHAANRHQIDAADLNDLARRLKHVRDKTIAHIDRATIVDPKAVWRIAGIKPQQLQRGLMSARRILGDLYTAEFGDKFSVPRYTGADVREIIQAAIAAGVLER
jgi:HEPN superfamily AbiU2-like protein